MGIEFGKLKIENFDQPTHTGKTGSGKGKQKYFKVGLKWVKLVYIVLFRLFIAGMMGG